MQIKVLHMNSETKALDHVATVNVPETFVKVEDALEYAYRWTNNIDGSWSRGETIESLDRNGSTCDNMDYNPNVEVHAALPVHNGRTYGLRSSSMGDVFVVVNDGFYICASFGFEKIEGV